MLKSHRKRAAAVVVGKSVHNHVKTRLRRKSEKERGKDTGILCLTNRRARARGTRNRRRGPPGGGPRHAHMSRRGVTRRTPSHLCSPFSPTPRHFLAGSPRVPRRKQPGDSQPPTRVSRKPPSPRECERTCANVCCMMMRRRRKGKEEEEREYINQLSSPTVLSSYFSREEKKTSGDSSLRRDHARTRKTTIRTASA